MLSILSKNFSQISFILSFQTSTLTRTSTSNMNFENEITLVCTQHCHSSSSRNILVSTRMSILFSWIVNSSNVKHRIFLFESWRFQFLFVILIRFNIDLRITLLFSSIFFDKKNEIVVKIMIIREIYLIDNLKTNMFIDNDLMKLKKIDINVTKKSIHIDNCDVIVVLNVKTSRIIVHTSIYVRKTIIVSSHIEIVLSIHFTIIFANRDFLFESKNFNLSFYVHLTNVEFKNILVKNDDDKSIHISRNCRVNWMIEIDFSNVYQMYVDDDNDVVEFVVRKSFAKHKINWFKRVIIVVYVVIVVIIEVNLSTINSSIIELKFLTIDLNIENSFSILIDYATQVSLSISQIFDLITSNVSFVSITTFSIASKVIFNNDITIHRFNNVVVQTFIDFVEKYLDLWKKTNFVDLSKKNWMKISFKID